MSDDVIVGNIIVGFGGVLVLALIGVAVHWYLGRRERTKPQDPSNTTPALPSGRPAR